MIRSRRAMIDFILHHTKLYVSDNGLAPFSFNIKMHRQIDLSFDNLLKLVDEKVDDARRVKLKEAYDDLGEDLYGYALESALQSYIEDDHFILPNRKAVTTELRVYGRSGGWLSIDSMNGHRFLGASLTDIAEMFNGDEPMQFTEVRNLYWLVDCILDGVKNRYTEVAHHAASILLSWEL